MLEYYVLLMLDALSCDDKVVGLLQHGRPPCDCRFVLPTELYKCLSHIVVSCSFCVVFLLLNMS